MYQGGERSLQDHCGGFDSHYLHKNKIKIILNKKKEFTKMYDDNHKKIYLNDKLRSEWNYDVIVHKDEKGNYYGKLVCEDNHS